MHVRELAIAIAVAALPLAVTAQTVRGVPQATRHLAPAALRSAAKPSERKFHPIPLGPHTFYGTITQLGSTSLTIRTRRQRLVNVDATTVLADGTYSAPLFVGKLVTVDGVQGANGVFTAAHILRMTNLNALPNDH